MVYTHNTLQDALRQFNMVYIAAYKYGETKKNYYCGITNDLERRQRAAEHNVDEYLTTAECDCFETACELEELLHEDGFDTGDQTGHGTEDSIFVYMYKKTTSTNP